jgi:predicted O-methyltransferase YrrM
MIPILEPDVEKYLNSLLPERDEVLSEMEAYASSLGIPIIGPACGRLLYQLTRLAGARRVFEMGSAIGYSTLWLARAVGEGGQVFYTDASPENARRAEAYFKRAGVRDQVQVRVGDALESLDAERGTFDLIFNDVDKEQYPETLAKALPRLRAGGLMITDNALWSGRVAGKAHRGDQATRAIQRFNRLIYSHPDLMTTIIPLRDGFAVCRKIR